MRQKARKGSSGAPAVSDIDNDELGVNYYDGQIFIRKIVSGVKSVIRVGTEIGDAMVAPLKAASTGDFRTAIGAISAADQAANTEARWYQSADVTSWASATPVTFTHGLGGIPKWMGMYLRCLTAQNGYAVGDIIGPFPPEGFNDGAGVGYGCILSATTIKIFWTGGAYVYVRPIAPDGNRIGAPQGSWSYFIRAQI